MVIHPAVITLAEAGFKLHPALGIDPHWVIVGEWDTYRRGDDINATIQIAQLIATFGARRCGEVGRGSHRIIAAEDCADILVLVAEQCARFESEGMIDDAVYWDMLAPSVEEAWAGLNVIQRMRFLKEQRADPEGLFAETVPPALFSELAAVVEDY